LLRVLRVELRGEALKGPAYGCSPGFTRRRPPKWVLARAFGHSFEREHHRFLPSLLREGNPQDAG
jgi:hypothetical protein